MYKYRYLIIIYFCSVSLFSFQQKKNDDTKENNYALEMAVSLKLSDRQIFGLDAIRTNYAKQLNRIDIFNVTDATILRKLNSLNEKKIKLFLGEQLYKRRVEFIRGFK